MKTGKILFPVMLIILGVFFWGCGQQDKTTQIFEIKNTQEIGNFPGPKYTGINKHYMIINPPQDLNELKILIKEFIANNSVETQLPKKENKPRYIDLTFYRESKSFPRNWQPCDDFFNEDRIEDHGDDCIASVRWTDDNPEKVYEVYKKQ